ncbi:hypothetical protein HYW74_02360 [Candidatus Pacearchaeota archaeon]|nr:hypothetical protein [Candidatus Pacearchaeota archaeon]
MNDENPILVLFESLLKTDAEKRILELIINEKSKEEIIEDFLKIKEK